MSEGSQHFLAALWLSTLGGAVVGVARNRFFPGHGDRFIAAFRGALVGQAVLYTGMAVRVLL